MREFINIVEDMQQKFTLSDAFWTWFGDSKVVDDSGQPLILYHGTASDIHSFKGMVWGSVTSKLAHEYAAFRSMKNGDADGSNILPVYMRIVRPFDADLGLSKTVTIGPFFNAVVEQATDLGVPLDESRRLKGLELLSTIRACAAREEAGPHFDRHDFWFEPETHFGRDGAEAIRAFFALFEFDGIRMMENGAMTYGAFSSRQVKSVFNAGSFDDSENISEDAGYTPEQQEIIGMAGDIAAKIKNPFNFCKQASKKFAEYLEDCGYEPTVLRCSGIETYAPNADKRWLKLGKQMYWTHYVVACDGIVIDLTRQQFFPDSPAIHVTTMPELDKEWLEISRVPEGDWKAW